MIQEVASKTTSKLAKTATSFQSNASVSKTLAPRCEVYEVKTRCMDAAERIPCKRIAAVEKDGKGLSQQILQQAGDHLEVSIFFQTPVVSADDVELELSSELLGIKALGHQDLRTC